MTRTYKQSLGALALALTVFTACGNDELPAYANVTVSFDDTIVVDQLRFEVLRDNNLVGEPAMRPEAAGGPLSTAITVTIILPPAVEGRDISVRVTGYFQGEPVTSGRIYNIVPLPGRGVDVNITLGHVLQTFTVDPSSVSLPLGATQQFVASATFSDENDGDVSEQATWTSSNTSVVTVSMEPGSHGLARAIGVGTATITVALQDQTLQIPVTITARRLEGLTLAPSLLSLALGNTAALRATAVYSDGQADDVSDDPGTQWQSNNPGVVTVDATGTLATLAQGNAEITARFGGRQATAPVVVSIPVVTSVVIEPSDTRIAKGFTRQFFAYGIRSDGSRVNITSSVGFSVSPEERATITGLGLLTGNSEGDVTITAQSAEGPVGTVVATITNATLSRFSISPTTPTVPQGQPVTFTATGVYSDGTDSDITSLVTWQSTNTAVATVPASGSSTYTTIAVGTTTVRALPPSPSPLSPVTTVLTVTDAVLDHITVAPSNSSIAKGQTATFTATGILTDNTTTDLTTVALWQSTNTTVATVAGNVATAAAVGTTNIRASFGGKTGQTALTVTAAQLLSIAITPSPVSVIVATNQQMVATGTYTDGTRAITDQVTWSITNQNPAVAGDTVATIGTTTGIVNGSHAGTATIRAVLSGVTGTLPLTVVNATLTTIDVLPASPAVIVGNTVQLTARGTFNNGTQQDITATVQWSSAQPAIATVNNNGATKGLVTGVGAGTATISASSGTCPGASCVTGTRGVAVSAAVVTSVTIDETSPLTLASGATSQLHATAHYNNGDDVDVTQTGVWASSATAVATIDNGNPFGGRVNVKTGITSNTNTTITVAFGGKTSSNFLVNVSAAVLNSIAITPATLSAAAGESGNLTATGTYSDTSTRNITTDVTWAITAQMPNTVGQTVATISNAAGEKGKVTTANQGTATASATLGSVSNTSTINVTQATATSIAVTCASYSLANGDQTQCTAIATLTNGTQPDVTNSANVTWSITPTSTATGTVVAGLLTGSSQGTLRVRCHGNVSNVDGDSPLVTIGPAVVRSVSVDPGTLTVAVGDGPQAFTATATYTDNSTVPNATATWESSNTAVATCDSTGTCTIVGAGTSTIKATISGKFGTAVLTVDP